VPGDASSNRRNALCTWSSRMRPRNHSTTFTREAFRGIWWTEHMYQMHRSKHIPSHGLIQSVTYFFCDNRQAMTFTGLYDGFKYLKKEEGDVSTSTPWKLLCITSDHIP
jgi:hypothetical protein